MAQHKITIDDKEFNADGGGVEIPNVKLKALTGGSSWNTRLSQIAHVKGNITICTYSLPDINYLSRIFCKRQEDVKILVNKKFESRAREMMLKFPKLEIYLKDDVHAKLVLLAPETVYIGSDNFGDSGWFEATVRIKSPYVYRHYIEQINKQIMCAEFITAH